MIYLILAISLSSFAQPNHFLTNIQKRIQVTQDPSPDQLFALNALRNSAHSESCKALLQKTNDISKEQIAKAPAWIGFMLTQTFWNRIAFTESDREFLFSHHPSALIKLKVSPDSARMLKNIEKDFNRAQTTKNPYEVTFGASDLPKGVELSVFNVFKDFAQIQLRLQYSDTEKYELNFNVTTSGDFFEPPATISEAVAKVIVRLLNYHSIFKTEDFAREVNELRYNALKLAALTSNALERAEFSKIAQRLKLDERDLLSYSGVEINILNNYIKAKSDFLTLVQASAHNLASTDPGKYFYETTTPAGYSFFYPHNNQFSTLMRSWIFDPSFMLNHPLFVPNRVVIREALQSIFSTVTQRSVEDFKAIPHEHAEDFHIQPLFTADHQVMDFWKTKDLKPAGLLYFDPKDGQFHSFQHNQEGRANEYHQNL